MDWMKERLAGERRDRRILHWAVAVAFVALFVTGLIVFVPAFSGLAAGGWTRVVHRAGAVILVAAPVICAVANPGAARQWLKEALLWNRSTAGPASSASTWKRLHKSLIALGFALFAVTGMVQWFLKGILPDQAFQWSLFVHDIVFYGGALVLAYHVYFEFNWWLWKRRYCRKCVPAYCVDACPTGALVPTPNGAVEYYPRRCNNCRLCMEYCRRHSYYRTAAAEEAPLPQAGSGREEPIST